VAIGSHGTAISSVIESAMPGKGGDFFKNLPYAAVTRLEVSDHQIVRLASLSENFRTFISLE
ncbi:MAG TPA: histidine phosphatase family protein, partial [Lactobacillus sp.]|nr:histidine phosphatase family protein [Lactobacillus sp.]